MLLNGVSFKKFARPLEVSIVYVLSLSLALSPTAGWAEGSAPNPQDGQAQVEQAEQVNQNIQTQVNNAVSEEAPAEAAGDPCKNDGSQNNPNPQKKEYCDAAKLAEKGSKNSKISMGVWAAVAALDTVMLVHAIVCYNSPATAGCAGLVQGYVYIATGLGAAATVGDAVMTKDMQNVMTGMIASLMPLGTTLIAGGSAPQFATVHSDVISQTNVDGSTFRGGEMVDVNSQAGKEMAQGNQLNTTDGQSVASDNSNVATQDGVSGADIAALGIAAATAAGQAMMKSMSAKKEKDSARENKKKAAELTSNTSAFDVNSVPILNGPNFSGRGASNILNSGNNSAATSGGDANTDAQGTNQNCSASPGDPSPHLQCAFAADSSLPQGFGSPEFANKFKEVTGSDLGTFLRNSETMDPAELMSGALGGGSMPLSSEAQSMASAAFIKMQEAVNSHVPGAEYQGGGGGSRGGGGGPDFGAVMQGLMGQLLPGDAEKDPKKLTGVSAIAFAMKNRSPAAIAEDPSLNIFDRVSFRYLVSSKKGDVPMLPSVQAPIQMIPARLPASTPGGKR